MEDTIIIGIAAGISAAIAAIYTRNRAKKIEPMIIDALQTKSEQTATELAVNIGLGNGWFATSRVIRALEPMVQKGKLSAFVPENTPTLQKVRSTRYTLK
jgi:hypothetical protein